MKPLDSWITAGLFPQSLNSVTTKVMCFDIKVDKWFMLVLYCKFL